VCNWKAQCLGKLKQCTKAFRIMRPGQLASGSSTYSGTSDRGYPLPTPPRSHHQRVSP
jgi:hypothetical protein